MYRIEKGDCIELMKSIPDGSIDLTVTSPPYDNLRTYENSIDWNFKIFTRIARELYRVTKDGGVVVWIVADATINGSESGSSFRQALFFKRIGFNIHDTMIWNKKSFTSVQFVRYPNSFEYMFVFTKNKPSTFNQIKDRKNIKANQRMHLSKRQKDGTMKIPSSNGNISNSYGTRYNVWDIFPEQSNLIRSEHPAIFPESLANDHILSWSNEGDTILDPFLGSGTTAKMAIRNNRNFIGFEKVEKYYRIAERRILEEIDKTALFNYDKAS